MDHRLDYISVLHIDKEGNITRSVFETPDGQYLNGTYTLSNNILYTPCRSAKGMTYGPSSVMEIKFE